VYEFMLTGSGADGAAAVTSAAAAFPALPYFAGGAAGAQPTPTDLRYFLAPDPTVAALLTWGMYAGIDAGTRNGFAIFGAIGAGCVRANLVQTPLLPLLTYPSTSNTLAWTPWRYYIVEVESWRVPVQTQDGATIVVDLARQITTLVVDTGTTVVMLPPDADGGAGGPIASAAATMNAWAGKPTRARGGPFSTLVLKGCVAADGKGQPVTSVYGAVRSPGPSIVFDASNVSYISDYSGASGAQGQSTIGAEDSCAMRVPSGRGNTFHMMDPGTSAAFSSNGSAAVLGAAGLQGLYLEFQVPPYGARALGIYQQPPM
jgi:hypothetical protein